MKALILSVSDKRHMAMSAPFIEYLQSNHIAFDVIRTNRYENRRENISCVEGENTVYEFNMVFPEGTERRRKALAFWRFRRYALRIIRRQRYDFLIIWNENTAALFSDLLYFRYRGRCCVNIRDVYYHERMIKQLVDLSIRASRFVTVPTPELLTDAPEKTICVFNRDTSLLQRYQKKSGFRERGLPLRVTHLGTYAKAEKASKELVELLGNDGRYELRFFGAGFDTGFKKWVEKKNVSNVVLGGAFPVEDTAKHLEETDIINSYYNRFTHPSLQISFGIKHSYTPMLRIPGLADENTCWGRISKKYGVAYLVNQENSKMLADRLYDWYYSLDWDSFCRNCEELNDRIITSVRELEAQLDEAFGEGTESKTSKDRTRGEQ